MGFLKVRRILSRDEKVKKYQSLSLGAMAMYNIMRIVPTEERSNFSQNYFYRICNTSKTTLCRYSKELQDNGLLKIETLRKEDGTFEYIYDVIE